MQRRVSQVHEQLRRCDGAYFAVQGGDLTSLGKSFPALLLPIVELYSVDCEAGNMNIWFNANRLFIEGDNPDERLYGNALMLLYGELFHHGDLVVAKVVFIHQRQGMMTRLYALLQDMAREYGVPRIMIESCNEASAAWARKNGFAVDEASSSALIVNWVAAVV